eukprot:gene940-2537_t
MRAAQLAVSEGDSDPDRHGAEAMRAALAEADVLLWWLPPARCDGDALFTAHLSDAVARAHELLGSPAIAEKVRSRAAALGREFPCCAALARPAAAVAQQQKEEGGRRVRAVEVRDD